MVSSIIQNLKYMNELIKITERDGKQAVSARELHAFLGVQTRFDMWAKRNILDNEFIAEGEDFCTIMCESTGGRPSTDYALSIVLSKKLSMMSKTDKGEMARNYFIECEKAAKESRKPLSHLEILVQSAQALLEQDKRISTVEQRLDKMDKDREENTKILLTVSVSTEKVPELSLRDKIRQCVNLYAEITGVDYKDVWHKAYAQLYYLYHISIKAYKKDKKETLLDVAERNQFLDKIYTVVSNMIREKQLTFQ